MKDLLILSKDEPKLSGLTALERGEAIHDIKASLQSIGQLLLWCLCVVSFHTIKMGRFSCPALKSALLHRPATRDRALQVAELLSKAKPGNSKGSKAH